jgi:hypothetical protein
VGGRIGKKTQLALTPWCVGKVLGIADALN